MTVIDEKNLAAVQILSRTVLACPQSCSARNFRQKRKIIRSLCDKHLRRHALGYPGHNSLFMLYELEPISIKSAQRCLARSPHVIGPSDLIVTAIDAKNLAAMQLLNRTVLACPFVKLRPQSTLTRT